MLEVEFYSVEELMEKSPFDVDFVSLYNPASHGPPALVAPGRERGSAVPTVARVEDKVLYINTAFVPGFTIERVSDRS